MQKVDPFDKKNYRPVSILPLSSNVYERVIYEQAPIILNLFSIKFWLNLEKYLVRNVLYLNY